MSEFKVVTTEEECKLAMLQSCGELVSIGSTVPAEWLDTDLIRRLIEDVERARKVDP